MTQPLTTRLSWRWISSKVSDACSETAHKASRHSSSVPEISGMINSFGIHVETAVRLLRPYSIPHAKIHRQPWPFCASAANGTLSSWVSKLKDHCGFAGIKLQHCTFCPSISLPLLLQAVCERARVWVSGKYNSWRDGRKNKGKSRAEKQWEQVENSSELSTKWQKIRSTHSARIRGRKAFTHYSTRLTAGEGRLFSFSNASVSVYVCISLSEWK